MMYYAHSLPNRPRERWQRLERHLREVANLASQFAAAFGSAPWGHLAGLWHDLGKYQEEFQRRLDGQAVAVEHAGIGARLAFESDPGKGQALAFVIAGHHGGLPNLQKKGDGLTDLVRRLRRNEHTLAHLRHAIPDELLKQNLPRFPTYLQFEGTLTKAEKESLWLRTEFWVRFLFSCLIDADRLNTADFTNPEAEKYRGEYSLIPDIRLSCDQYIEDIVEALSLQQRSNPVNQARFDILRECREAAVQPQGTFSLTVPTGGGKTLSGMSFALRHAEYHNLRRIVVVIPYTSIIEQNAKVYRQALGANNVLEHHSNLDPEKECEEKGEESASKHRLAAENWDVPIIVTTSVQFFETLFASKPSKVRKLHNIARSVILLDEVQTLPPALLNPILDGLNQLVLHYGCSVVLSTATPPALIARERFEQGLKDVRPIINKAAELAKRLNRVEIEWPGNDEDVLDLRELAEQLAKEERVLCVVHRRRDARKLAQHLIEGTGRGVFHLSALMCPAHRLNVIDEIQRCLIQGAPCRVVSTQLIEAGVDLDFPVVYRALGGLDSVVQAAGRCNREGKLALGRVIVFRAASKPPNGVPRTALDVMESLLKEKLGRIDATDPMIFEQYFRILYFSRSLDEKNIQSERRRFNFATVSRDFQMIEDGFTRTVIVPWGDSEDRLSRLRRAVEVDLPTRDHLRRLQPYTVSVYTRSFDSLHEAGALEEILDGIYVLSPTHEYLYDGQYGLLEGEEPPVADAESLVL